MKGKVNFVCKLSSLKPDDPGRSEVNVFLSFFLDSTVGGSSEALGKLTEQDMKFLFIT